MAIKLLNQDKELKKIYILFRLLVSNLLFLRKTGSALFQPVLESIKPALNKRRNKNVNTNMWNIQNDADEKDALHAEA
jgi:TfoX/Sxy family transcriptional regulator of competence genes